MNYNLKRNKGVLIYKGIRTLFFRISHVGTFPAGINGR